MLSFILGFLAASLVDIVTFIVLHKRFRRVIDYLDARRG